MIHPESNLLHDPDMILIFLHSTSKGKASVSMRKFLLAFVFVSLNRQET